MRSGERNTTWLFRTLVRAALAEPFLRRARAQAARGVEVSHIDVAVVVSEGRTSILAEYTLRATEPVASNVLLLDSRACPFPILAVEGEALRPWVRWRTGRGPIIVTAIELRDGRNWDGVRFRITMDWTVAVESERRAAPICCIVPESLPSVLGWHATGGHQRGTVSVSATADRYYVCGIPWRGADSHTAEHRYAQAVVLPLDAFAGPCEGQGIWVSHQVQGSLSEGRGGWARSLLHSVSRFLLRCSGVDPGTDFVLVHPAEMRGHQVVPNGPCLAIDPSDFGLRDSEDPSQDLAIAAVVGGAWWGCGVQVTGRNARELEAGVAVGHALRWLKQVGEEEHYQYGTRMLDQKVRSGRLRDFAMGLDRFPRPRMTAAIALAVDRGLADHPAEATRAIQEFTRRNWCRVVDSEAAATALRDGGIELPVLAG